MEELAELFEGRTRLVELLAEREHPFDQVDEVLAQLSEGDLLAALDAHPRIGQRSGLSARSSQEQGSDPDPELLAELDRLNRDYEEKFGFRFVVFVNRRPRSAIVPILRERLGRTRDQELETGVRELVAIARDRWTTT